MRGFLIRFLVTVLAMACAIYIVFFEYQQEGFLPFHTETRGAHTLSVKPWPHIALPEGLQAGDQLDLRKQPLATRAALNVFHLRAGETYTLVVNRHGQTANVPVTTVREPAANVAPASVFFPLYFLIGLFLVLGLVTLWWGQDKAAWAVSVWAFTGIFASFSYLSLPALGSVAIRAVDQTFNEPLHTLALYLMALALIGAELTPRVRRLLDAGLIVTLGAFLVVPDVLRVAFVAFGIANMGFEHWTSIAFLISFLFPLATLTIGYARADAAKRSRLRWVLWGLALLTVASEYNNLPDIFGPPRAPEQLGTILGTLFGVAGVVYGLLFKRVVKLGFVINRTLVYGLTALVVVAIFALLEQVVQSFTIGGHAGLALTLGVALVVGIGLDAVKKRIDSLIEQVFFRRKFLAESALRSFARQCAFIEHPERLLDEAVGEIREYIDAPRVAVYERAGDSYARVRQRGSETFPERVETDDRAFVTLRAELAETDLHATRTALGADGYAFPMAVRGVLQGALVVGARPEHYSPDERELMGHVTHQVGIALHALRAQDNEALVDALANGNLEPTTAQRRARQLRGTWAAV
jgi:hypothetical protein